MPRPRDIVIVDVKTSGDRVNVVGQVPIEIAWWNLANGNFGDPSRNTTAPTPTRRRGRPASRGVFHD